MFFSFCRGRMTSLTPTRRAARTFSLMPPTGSTRPDRVISPVIAMSPRTGRPVSSDAIAAAMVTPADGPSFGIAPDGTCTWISAFLKKSGSMLYSFAWVRSHESAARVAANHLPQRVRGERDVLRRQPVVLDLLVDEVIGRNLQLLFLGVAGDLEHLHPIFQRRRNGVENVGGRDEEHLGQIERHIQV